MRWIFLFYFSLSYRFIFCQDVKIYHLEKGFSYELPSNIWKDIFHERDSCLKNGIFTDNIEKKGVLGDLFVYNKYFKLRISDSVYHETLLNKMMDLESQGYIAYPKVSLFPSSELPMDDTELSDGKYKMMYSTAYDGRVGDWVEGREYCSFNVVNGLVEGSITFFSFDGDTLIRGTMREGKKDGEWNCVIPFNGNQISKKYCDNKEGSYEYIMEYKEGILNGKFVFKVCDIIRSEGSVKANIPVGEWHTYFENGALANKFTLLEEPIRNKDFIFKHFPSRNDSLPSGTKWVFIPGFNEEVNGGLNYQVLWRGFKGKYKTYLDGEFLAYYRNGNLKCKFLFRQGKLVEGDKVFYENKSIKYEWQEKGKKGIFRIYNIDGTLKKEYILGLKDSW